MLSLSLQDILIRVGAYALVAAIAGAIGFLVLRALGGKPGKGADGGAGYAFFDIVGMLGAVLFRQSWGRSPQPEPGGMRGGRLGLVIWVLATLVLTFGAVWLLRYGRAPIASLGTNVFTQSAVSILQASNDIGTWFVIISILPIPPLLGGNILLALFPSLRANARKFYWPGTAIVALLIGLGFAEAVLRPVFVLLRGWLG